MTRPAEWSPPASGTSPAARRRSARSGARLELDLGVVDESHLPGAREGHLAELFEAAGLRDVTATELSISLEHATFDEWWEPYTRGVGPAGAYVASLDDAKRAALRDRCRAILPDAPFVLKSVAWAAPRDSVTTESSGEIGRCGDIRALLNVQEAASRLVASGRSNLASRSVVRAFRLLLILAIIAGIGYVAYVGYEGSRQAVSVDEARSRDCRTPDVILGRGLRGHQLRHRR